MIDQTFSHSGAACMLVECVGSRSNCQAGFTCQQNVCLESIYDITLLTPHSLTHFLNCPVTLQWSCQITHVKRPISGSSRLRLALGRERPLLRCGPDRSLSMICSAIRMLRRTCMNACAIRLARRQTFDSYAPNIARLSPKLYKINGIQVNARPKSNINQRF